MNTNTPNELIHETSPYLQQHAYNPVQWLPWGDKALSRARNENKPIFLSIGYSACHWCHVMERECFMDPDIAAVLNEFFIPIKVDREERPDVDHIYMTALQSMSEHSGWPLNMFLTPNAEPFYGGTFFPKDDDQGVPGFENVLKILAKTWSNDQHNVILQSKQLTQHLKVELNRTLPIEPVPKDFLRISVEKLQSYYDADNGGFHGAPKFPHAFYWDLYVELLKHEKNKTLQDSLQFTLHKMAEGGLYDQLAGGFHRYSTDALWYLPHFEKMLYDNAVLARTYFEASQVVDKDFNLRIGKEICDYILREMSHTDGAFYSSTDADTDDIEGKHFVWCLKELREVLGDKDASLFAKIFHIEKDDYELLNSTRGTPPHDWFEGHILCLTQPLEEECTHYKTSLEHIQSLKQKLYKHRQTQRTLPFRDEKILTSWNGLMIQALVVGYELTGEQTYLAAAKKALQFLETHLMQDGHVLSTWKDGKAQHKGTLEDYAHLLSAFLALHRVTKDSVSLQKAKTLCDKTLSLFWEDEESWFYYTSDTDLLIRAKNLYDQALPSSHSVMAENLLYLSKTLKDQRYQDILDRMLVHISGFINKVPHTVSSLIKVASRNMY